MILLHSIGNYLNNLESRIRFRYNTLSTHFHRAPDNGIRVHSVYTFEWDQARLPTELTTEFTIEFTTEFVCIVLAGNARQ